MLDYEDDGQQFSNKFPIPRARSPVLSDVFNLYVKNPTTNEIRPAFLNLVNPADRDTVFLQLNEQFFIEAHQAPGMMLASTKGVDKDSQWLKPQFKEVKVETKAKEEEELHGISTLGMSDHQKGAFQKCFSRVEELEKGNDLLRTRIMEYKRAEMMWNMDQKVERGREVFGGFFFVSSGRVVILVIDDVFWKDAGGRRVPDLKTRKLPQ